MRSLAASRILARLALALGMLFLFAALLDRVPLLLSVALGVCLTGLGLWLRRRLPRQSIDLKGWALAALMTGLSLLLLEAAVRVAFPPPALPPELYEPHPSALFALRPGTDIVQRFENLEQAEALEVPVRINMLGMRGAEVPEAKPPGEMRVLCVGDSYTFGWGSLEASTYPAQLEALLQERFPATPIRVLNSGTGGQGPWQERILLNERGFPLQPDLVVLQIFPGNDLSDSLLREGTTTLEAFPVDTFDMAAAYRVIDHPVARANEWLRRDSRLFLELETRVMGRWMLVRMYNRLRFVTLPGYRPPQPPGKRSWIVEPDLKQWYPQLDEAWRRLTTDVAGIHADCEARGIPVAAFAMPWLAGEERYATEVAKYGAEHYERDKAAHRVEDFLASTVEIPVPMVDALRAEPDQEALIFPADGHLNRAGNSMVARRVAEALAPEIAKGLQARPPS